MGLGIAAVAGLSLVMVAGVLLFNTLIARKNGVENAFGGIDAMLKKRYDLIPNLVGAVEAYMKHERDLLTQLTELRTRALKASGERRLDVDQELSQQLRGLMVAVENYPDLKASESFRDLQASLNEIEEQISAARRAYNAAVTDFNNAVEMFPTNVVAGLMRYQRKAILEIPQVERENVDLRAMLSR